MFAASGLDVGGGGGVAVWLAHKKIEESQKIRFSTPKKNPTPNNSKKEKKKEETTPDTFFFDDQLRGRF